MPYAKTTVEPGTCPICGLPRPAAKQITCAKCWHHVLNGKDRQELAAIHRQAGKNSDAACAPKCAKIVRRLMPALPCRNSNNSNAEPARASAEGGL